MGRSTIRLVSLIYTLLHPYKPSRTQWTKRYNPHPPNPPPIHHLSTKSVPLPPIPPHPSYSPPTPHVHLHSHNHPSSTHIHPSSYPILPHSTHTHTHQALTMMFPPPVRIPVPPWTMQPVMSAQGEGTRPLVFCREGLRLELGA